MTDNHLVNREAQKAEAIRHIQTSIDEISRRDSAPDLWERVHLVDAISAVLHGLYASASATAEKAMVNQKNQSPRANLSHAPIYGDADISSLRRWLEKARDEPVKSFPTFR